MTKEAFQKNLSEAAHLTIKATKDYVLNKLPDEVLFLIVPNCSFDGNPLGDDEEVFPSETLPEWTTLPPKTENETVDHLCRNGKVPEWINILVDSADDKFTYLLLECCGRFTGLEKHLYYTRNSTPPFGLKIPMPSLEYKLEKDGRFRLSSRYNKAG